MLKLHKKITNSLAVWELNIQKSKIKLKKLFIIWLLPNQVFYIRLIPLMLVKLFQKIWKSQKSLL